MKTFVFFIGGTGARVLRSLTMLMASGVSLNEGDSIVPIMVDYDATNADLKRTNELLGAYNAFHKICDYDNDRRVTEGFFKTRLGIDDHGKTMDPLVKMSFDDDKSTFGRYIGYEALDSLKDRDGNNNICKSTKLLIESLYDSSSSESRDRELNLELRFGFKGNPNIGSVVFNEYFKSAQYQAFKDNFSEGDRIFIVASIFGGTGSSGLPQIVKKVRETIVQQMDNEGTISAIRKAMLGACVVLPYFRVNEDPNSAINSLTFKSKAKAALNYYHDEINDKMSEVFYIGCNEQQETGYENHEGGEKQENKAHIVELLSAMSIIEFAKHTRMQENEATRYYEYTSLSSSVPLEKPLPLSVLSKPNDEDIYQNYVKPLSAFALCVKYFLDCTRKEEGRMGLLRSSYYKNLQGYLAKGTDFSDRFYNFSQCFVEWANELNENSILKFYPYNFGAKHLYELIRMNNTNSFKKYNFDDIITRKLNEGSANENGKEGPGAKVYLRYAYNGCMKAVEEIN